jgi:hypothetical protein
MYLKKLFKMVLINIGSGSTNSDCISCHTGKFLSSK